MKLRNLELKDAPFMLELHSNNIVVHDLDTNFVSKTLSDAESFVLASQDTSICLNLAIVSDTDEYMGTVSLKQIDLLERNAEFAITVRKKAMGHGYAWFGMETIIRKAFAELGFEKVYWCVSNKNLRAIRFYEKHNYRETTDISPKIMNRFEDTGNLKWYSIQKRDVSVTPFSVAGCKVIHIKTIPAENAGELSFFEADYDVPFSIKRIYYITKVPEGVRRGFHAHKKLQQLIFCPFGKIQLTLDSGNHREEITLSDPSIGILIERPIWREMLWLQKDSVLCVVASDYYMEQDYIRDFQEFKDFINKTNI